MSTFKTLVQYAPKRLGAFIAILAAVVIVPIAVAAYGPERDTFTFKHPAPYVTFNSITDNPDVGDERNFVRIKEDSTSTQYSDSVTVQPGKTYQVQVYYHNNASSDLNASGKGIAKDVSLRMQMSASIAGGKTDTVDGFINSSNANPKSVWDSANIKNGSSDAVALRYVADSAKVTSNGAVDGKTLPSSFLTTGTPLGYDSLNGTLKGCNEFAGYVTYKFTVVQPSFTVNKTVSVDGGKTFAKTGVTKPDSTVIYKVAYTNTGSTKQENVNLSDKLPTGVTYVPGSSLIANSETKGSYAKEIDGITTTGVNIGSYAPNGGNAFFKFSAKTPAADALKCGTNIFKNTARATTSSGYKESSADITINKVCTPPVGDINVCELATKNIITIKENAFDASKHSKNLSDCDVPPVTPPTETPPEELPHTGMTENIVAVIGLGALIASLTYYVASRRALNQ